MDSGAQTEPVKCRLATPETTALPVQSSGAQGLKSGRGKVPHCTGGVILMQYMLTIAAALLALPYWKGVDASFVPQYRDLNVPFYVGQARKDPLEALAKAGNNLLRLRIWVDPRHGYCDLAHTLAMAKDGQRLGMDLLLDFHYSDDWADPGKQYTPKKWSALDLDGLKKAVREHSRTTVQALVRQGTPPAIVQIGNEVRAGMLWPLGKVSGEKDMPAFAALLKAGIEGTRQGLGGRNCWIMVHNDYGANNGACRWFYDQLKAQDVAFDMIGLSYYPWWHGSLEDLQKNVNDLADRYKMPIMVVETAYPFTLETGDPGRNFVGEEKQLLPGYPATREGQTAYLRKLHQIMKSIPEKRGAGVVYWAPEYVAAPGMPTPCENLCLFDLEHRLLPGAAALGAK
jgi:arabinogalactan endo-1,4-beta-galactosidase